MPSLEVYSMIVECYNLPLFVCNRCCRWSYLGGGGVGTIGSRIAEEGMYGGGGGSAGDNETTGAVGGDGAVVIKEFLSL